MRDLRDPTKLGEAILFFLGVRGTRYAPSEFPASRLLPVGSLMAPNYDDGGIMSADPAHHHSRTPQNIKHGDGDFS